jgi:hypothetical protein
MPTTYRPSSEDIQNNRRERKKAQRELRDRQKAQGLVAPSRPSATNRKSEYQSVDEEQEARQDATVEQMRVIRAMLPILLARLSKIPDFRNPKKIKHRLTVVMTYGVLMFVYQMSSRRESNQTMTLPAFKENLRFLLPELEDMPHHDTLNRILYGIGDVNEIEGALCDLLEWLIRKKKFRRYLVEGKYAIAIDGTQKMVRKDLLSSEWLQRVVGQGEDKEGKTQYYVYVLEANLVFRNGIVIPLMSEFLDYGKGDTSREKQDCEQRSFYRLADRLKERFPRLPIMILLDGLFSNGPIVAYCAQEKHWDFMIVLQDDSLPSVWEEYHGLKVLAPENSFKRTWGNRRQRFQWVNDIEYTYGKNGRKRLTVHVVVCEESWEDIDEKGQIVTRQSRHAWLSARPLTKSNAHERCNLGARHRWGIESGILLEKRYGYNYEHCFSYSWDAMRGFHYLMRIGHALNVLVQYSSLLFKKVRKMGIRRFIAFVRETISGRWLKAEEVHRRFSLPFQLRL